jgi:hypothetical protein
VVGGVENSGQYVVRDRVREEMGSDVAAFVNGAIEAAFLLLGESGGVVLSH